MEETQTALEEFAALEQKRIALLQKLRKGRDFHSEQLKEYNKAIDQIESRSATQEAVDAASMSAPSLVLHVLATLREGSATEILETAQKIQPGVNPANIHSAIFRLAGNGKIGSTGSKGSMVYSAKE